MVGQRAGAGFRDQAARLRPPSPAGQESAILLPGILLLPLGPPPLHHPPGPSSWCLARHLSREGCLSFPGTPHIPVPVTLTPAQPCPRLLAASKVGPGDCAGIGQGHDVLMGSFLEFGPTAVAPALCVEGSSEDLALEGTPSFPKGVGPLLSGLGFQGWFVLLPFWHWAPHRSTPATNWCFNCFSSVSSGYPWCHGHRAAHTSSSLLLSDPLRGSERALFSS